MNTNVIELQQVTKRYGDFAAVDDFSLTVCAGESLGLIGHNGAGKSTVFKLMLGLIQPSGGQMLWHQRVANEATLRDARREVGYLPENLALFDNLTGRETLHFFARLKKLPSQQIDTLLDEVKLRFAAERRVATYSKGMRQRLGLAQALLGSPRILFLDEPTNGLDPEGVRDLYDAVEKRRQQGCTVIVTSHVLADIEQRVQTLAIMKNGRLAAHGSIAQLRQQQTLPLRAIITLRTDAQNSPLRTPLLTQLLASEWLHCTHSGQHLELHCHPKDKLRLLHLCQPYFDQMDDFSWREANLEDLFFGAQS